MVAATVDLVMNDKAMACMLVVVLAINISINHTENQANPLSRRHGNQSVPPSNSQGFRLDFRQNDEQLSIFASKVILRCKYLFINVTSAEKAEKKAARTARTLSS